MWGGIILQQNSCFTGRRSFLCGKRRFGVCKLEISNDVHQVVITAKEFLREIVPIIAAIGDNERAGNRALRRPGAYRGGHHSGGRGPGHGRRPPDRQGATPAEWNIILSSVLDYPFNLNPFRTRPKSQMLGQQKKIKKKYNSTTILFYKKIIISL